MKKPALFLVAVCATIQANAQDVKWILQEPSKPYIKRVEKKGRFDSVEVEWRQEFTARLQQPDKKIQYSRTYSVDSIITYKPNAIITKLEFIGKITGMKVANDTFQLKFPFNDSIDTVRSFPVLPQEPQNGESASTKKKISYWRDTSLNKPQLRQLHNRFYKQWRPNPKTFISVSGSLDHAFRTLFIDDPKFSRQTDLDQRQANESAVARATYKIQAGVRIRHSNYITFTALHLTQGFRSRQAQLDWTTGLPSQANNKNYRFNFWGLGAGYTKARYWDNAGIRFETSLYFLHRYQYGDPDKIAPSDATAAGLKKNLFAGNIFLGPQFRLGKHSAIHFGLQHTFGFTPISRGVLATHLHNTGLQAGLSFWFNQSQAKIFYSEQQKRSTKNQPGQTPDPTGK